ncbi:MAG: hypothetical protein LBJ01_07530 [Tannerella sp.]|jgi:hypothetical protein|nr:hypothetical protein [Tannerella sp.]
MSYLPQNMAALISWGDSFFVYLGAHQTEWGVSAPWVTEVSGKFDRMKASHDVWNNPATQTKAAHADMEEKRAAFEQGVEPLVQNLKTLPGLTPYDYEMLQIPEPGRGKHHPKYGKPKGWPLLWLAVQGQGSVEFHCNDVATPNSTARPRGVHEAVVRMGFTDKESPSIDDLTYTPLTMTRTPQRRLFPPEYAGQTLHAIAAWVNPTGERGPWGPMVKIVVS